MRILLICLLSTTAYAQDYGVRETDNEPWPVLSEHKCMDKPMSCIFKGGAIAFIQRHCGVGANYAKAVVTHHARGQVATPLGCTVPEVPGQPELGVRIYWSGCEAVRLHELRHASEGTREHTTKFKMDITQGRSICYMDYQEKIK